LIVVVEEKNEKTKKYHAVRKVPKYKIRAVVVVVVW
jgi:hypothetical protein